MNKKPLVSIIMNCYNGEKYLEDSLKSIINQTYKNWELIFWDNLSTDKSKKIFEKYKDKRFKYFYAKKRTVLYEARNLAIKKAKGEFIAFLDVDDFWTKDKLHKQLPKFKNKEVGLVYSNFFKFFEKNKRKEIAYKSELPKGKVTGNIIKDYRVGFISIILRKKFILRMKKIFDYNYDLISDFDFILHFSIKHKFACINEPLAYYRIHSEQLQKKEMINQANQYCKWYKEKKISKTFKNYDLSTIHRKYDYFNLLKELNSNKIKLFLKMFKNFNFVNFIKITAIIFLPKKILYNLIQNV
tara:strand:- start:958 stop:1854 length:897 start_codon:yes stop_codon:yes gene_type:complete